MASITTEGLRKPIRINPQRLRVSTSLHFWMCSVLCYISKELVSVIALYAVQKKLAKAALVDCDCNFMGGDQAQDHMSGWFEDHHHTSAQKADVVNRTWVEASIQHGLTAFCYMGSACQRFWRSRHKRYLCSLHMCRAILACTLVVIVNLNPFLTALPACLACTL